jgi:hypothetical protein
MRAIRIMINVVLLLAVVTAVGQDIFPNQDFVNYMKSASNTHNFGLGEDGRFYPYTNFDGRLIAYGFPVQDKSWYKSGLSVEDANSMLNEKIRFTEQELKEHFRKNLPAIFYEKLSNDSREILIDFAFTEGVDGLSKEFIKLAAAEDWDKLIKNDLLIRHNRVSARTDLNRLFSKRWDLWQKSVDILAGEDDYKINSAGLEY